MKNFVYYTPTKVVFGRDAAGKAGEEAKQAGKFLPSVSAESGWHHQRIGTAFLEA